MTSSLGQIGLEGQTIAFRADASIDIGSGHVMRCLTLAEALRARGAECHFLSRVHNGHLCEVIESRGFHVHRLPLIEAGKAWRAPRHDGDLTHSHWLGAPQAQDAVASCSVLTGLAPSWLVVDHYALDSRWEREVLANLTPLSPRLLVIDDLADRQHLADLLLDQNLGREASDYDKLVPERCRVLAGSRFALLRPEFARWRVTSLARRANTPRFKRMLISLGGMDKDNVTSRVLEALKCCSVPDDLSITVVMGATAPGLEHVRAKARELSWPTEVVVNVSDMARRMAEADLAIGGAGSTSWERCCLGLPTLMLVLAENQREAAGRLHQARAAVMLGDATDICDALPQTLEAVRSASVLREMSARAGRLVDGSGVARVLSEMSSSHERKETADYVR